MQTLPSSSLLVAQQLSFQLDTGEWLFKNIHFSLADRFTGLVGRNGVGKSVLLSLLLGKKQPTEGQIIRHGQFSYYSQQPSILLNRDVSVVEFLGISKKRQALRAISQGECEQRYFDIVGEDWSLESDAQEVLKSLRIEPDLDAYCHSLSGGQIARLQLHQCFQSGADVLLLDEPSNHLDEDGRQWLIEQCHHFDGQILLVTHDRNLLNQVDAIVQMTHLGLDYFKGNYDHYLAQSTLQTTALNKKIAQVKSEQKKCERQAQLSQEKAQQRAAQGNRLRRSGSQPKILLDAMKNKAGQSQRSAVKQQRNQQDSHKSKLQSLKAEQVSVAPQAFYFSSLTSFKKKTLLNIENCVLKYGGMGPYSFAVKQGERYHLQGKNGCGKSTLLKAIHGSHPHLLGTISCHVQTVYLDQHFSLLNEQQSILDSLLTYTRGITLGEARTLLAGIGFRRDNVHRKVAHLSGGEKMKLSMLIVTQNDDETVLLLDEPDNHLDIESKSLLAMALQEYKGAFILVSHDSSFVLDANVRDVIAME
ncbi:ABC-F family ATP-binding cassette domain-containing protein [Vibrio methylphosphonaticus]|uniref:ABC-F family ATP-binding cassette domain-containing protein n=1 Tax=Vibrio methylphosphonaticus TaxID=2946866 RepID=UPI00202AA651|nr:ABC-F family ATP-binding cassette domain-containing protein [Vibrio methylphosphonaticus]MCL9773783.1 ATP-binding cassette domain-containing protein [Vibrio methylphosphonaticus]